MKLQRSVLMSTLALLMVILVITVSAGTVTSTSSNESTTQTGPTADFTISPSKPLPDEKVAFDASESTAGSSDIVSYEWSYEVSTSYSDQTATSEIFSHTFEENGKYEVTLEVEDANGERDSTTQTVTVDGEDPSAEFTISPSDPLPEEQVIFDASESTAPSGEIENYEWSYEVSTSYSDEYVSGESFSHTFEENGKYEVTLEVEDNGGATDSTTKTVEVGGEDPSAEFSISPSDPLPDEKVSFDASESTAPAGSIEDYEWSYEVSTSYSDEYVSGESFSHTFEENGKYEVTLEVEDNGGATDSTTKTVEVGGEDPTAEFSISPSDPLPEEEVTFDASESTAPAGNIEDYEWSYEVSTSYSDESVTGESFSHSFEENGEYEITLEVEDNGGATDSTTKTVEVGGKDPTAEFSISSSDPLPEEEVTFDASESTAPAGNIEDYEWSYEVSTSYSDQSKTGDSFSHTFEQPGEYDVTLEIEDNGGATDSTTKTIDVGGEGPTASFDMSPSQPAPNQEVIFDASGSESTVGEIETYEWDYETSGYSGGSGSGESASHSFDAYGEYDVTLTITDVYGQSNSVSKTVTVTGDGPTADFDVSPSNPGLDERVVFDGSVSTAPDLSIEDYRWFINGEARRGGSEISGTFDEAGIYNVELEVENTAGKTDRISKTVPVGDKEDIVDNPDFELVRASPDTESVAVNPGETLSFVSEIDSEEVPEATQSLFVDGEVVKQSEVDSKNIRTAHQFEELGEHTVEVELKGEAGKSDVIKWDVTTHPFNSLPTVAEQSSSQEASLDGNTDILTFSIQNPDTNDREINAEIVAELPDGVSISGASDVSSGDAAIQASQTTIRPGRQESMRLDINIGDDSLDGERITIPYQVRYQPVGGSNVSYTANEREFEIIVGSAANGGGAVTDQSPGFGVTTALISIFGIVIVARRVV